MIRVPRTPEPALVSTTKPSVCAAQASVGTVTGLFKNNVAPNSVATLSIRSTSCGGGEAYDPRGVSPVSLRPYPWLPC